MNANELMDVRDHLQCLLYKTMTGKQYNRIVESIRVVQRDINLATTDYVRGTRIPIFKKEFEVEDRMRARDEHNEIIRDEIK